MRKIDEIDAKFKIRISGGGSTVEAPLPDDYGFTVGSEYTTPFDIGSMSGMIQKAFALGRISAPVGLRMRKMYANPEPTELSFKMSFDAYYDAVEEVLKPVVTLIKMGLGREMTNADINEKIEGIGGIIDMATGGGGGGKTVEVPDGAVQMSSRVSGLIKLINAPDLCSLSFGTFLTMDEVFITSTAVTFSNIMDERGVPMSADVEVTCTLQTAPIADDIARFFGDM